MKKLLLLFTCLFFLPFIVNGQEVINNFDAIPDSTYWSIYADGGEHTYINLSLETANVHGGTGALKIEWQNECYDQYGGWIGMSHMHPDSLGLYDFSMYTHISMWYYNEVKQSKSGKVHWRIILRDAGAGTILGSTDGADYEVWFSHHYVLDNDPGWNHIYIEMKDVGMESGEGFWAPGWGQNVEGNGIFELDKIHGWTLEFSQDGSLWQEPDDTVSGVFIIDDFELQGIAPVNVVFFNGKSVPGNVCMSVGWSGAVEVTDEDAFTPGTNSVKWTTGDGWDGVNFLLSKPKNLLYNWSTDSVQFKMKAPAGLGDINLVFHDVDEDGAEKVDYPFQAAYLLLDATYGWDGTWKEIKVALADFNRFNGCWDNDLSQTVPGEFDSTKLQQFTIGGFGQAFAGMTVYFDDIWTGNPEFDWTPPAEVTGISAVPSDYYNLVIWEDVAGEIGETYNVYASPTPTTDLTAAGVELVAEKVVEGTQTAVHWLWYPLKDTEIKYYYFVECADAAGNLGPACLSAEITNTAKGVPTISLNPPANFVADGDLSEWDASGIMPWVLTPETDNVAIGVVDDSNDLTATVYLAIDDNDLYVAIDVIDNVFSYATTGNWWEWDAFELYLGFYDWRCPCRHTSLIRGAEPDYKLIFLLDQMWNEFRDSRMYPEDENYHFEELGGADYVAEAKIPLDSIALANDTRFHPKRGMRIPFDLYFHDNDGAGWEGNLSYSPWNTDLAWSTCREWTYTWIGDTTYTTTAVEENQNPFVVREYSLSQNFPNPFNPTTTISFSIPKAGRVTIDIFNTLGQKIQTLVDEHKAAGRYTIELKGNKLPTGIYFYRMRAGDFSQIKKMMLVK